MCEGCRGQETACQFAESKSYVKAVRLSPHQQIFVTPCWLNSSPQCSELSASRPVTMPRKSPSPLSPIRTCPKNKNTHPGVIVQAPPRRSSAEIQQEHAAKAQAKAAQEAEKQQNIQCTAAFELTDMINEDVADATPHLALFTPKPQPHPKCKKAIPALIAEGSDDPDNSHDTSSSFSPKPSASSEDSVTEEEPASEIDSQSPIPAKMLKAKVTRKATTKMSHAPPA
jgi:hypothetical protein